MRFSIFLLVFVFSLVRCKNRVKALTESMGQEVIEIGALVKDLPPGLDEEPSVEFEEDDKTSTTSPPATKRETKKTTTLATTTVTQKTVSELGSDSQDDEEQRIETELSEVYKDTDYKAEPSTNSPTERIVETSPALRQKGRANFKFQPDVNDRDDVERFRTSVDDISCQKRVTQRLQEETYVSSGQLQRSTIEMCSALLLMLSICQ